MTDGSLVSLKAYHEKGELYLTIFSNEQGHYLPAISDAGTTPFWRIQKAPTNLGQNNKLIRDGDEIRLCWSFDDQRGGFRDYTNDVFGRRRFHVRDDEPQKLYLKVPFPGFQKSDSTDGTAMIMDTREATDPYITLLNVLPHDEFKSITLAYNLFDLSFRLDIFGYVHLPIMDDLLQSNLNSSIDSPGQQELNDFMVCSLKQPTETILMDAQRLEQRRESVFAWYGKDDALSQARRIGSIMGEKWQSAG